MRSKWIKSLAMATISTAKLGCAALLVLLACEAPVFAKLPGGGGTPEIDPGSAASALTLLIGGALVLTDRVRRK